MLIDEALATATAATPVGFGDVIELGPKQAMVYAIYHAAKANREGLGGSDAEIERFVGSTKGAGIAEDEIAGALAAAEGVR